MGPNTKLVSFTQVSNALGTITPAREIIEMAHNAAQKYCWMVHNPFHICVWIFNH
ncbi:MAG: aminotransferase class V-fold PLP-dependent enzyme [Puia sp.]